MWVEISTGRSRWVEEGSEAHRRLLGEIESSQAPAIIPDEGSFTSPIDGLIYTGRAGMREHNRKHDVVNNRDLAGLPYLTANEPYKVDKKQMRADIIEGMKRRGHFDGQ